MNSNALTDLAVSLILPLILEESILMLKRTLMFVPSVKPVWR